MAIRKYKPTTQTRRFTAVSSFEAITRKKPERALTGFRKRHAGRNSAGRISVRHRGGGNRRKYRKIDFKRNKYDIPATVISIEYDPNRSAYIALLSYTDGEKRYILAPEGLVVGTVVISGKNVEPSPGNVLPLEKIPLGANIHNIECEPGRGGQLVRSAGVSAVLVSKEGSYATVKLPSGEVRMIHTSCLAAIGQVGNGDHENISRGKAGHSRWLGIRPTVRGCAVNPIDHPMGGGEGRASGGHPQSPWNQYAKGKKTRKKHSKSNRLILARRK